MTCLLLYAVGYFLFEMQRMFRYAITGSILEDVLASFQYAPLILDNTLLPPYRTRCQCHVS